jgi:hypothetical protein
MRTVAKFSGIKVSFVRKKVALALEFCFLYIGFQSLFEVLIALFCASSLAIRLVLSSKNSVLSIKPKVSFE